MLIMVKYKINVLPPKNFLKTKRVPQLVIGPAMSNTIPAPTFIPWEGEPSFQVKVPLQSLP